MDTDLRTLLQDNLPEPLKGANWQAKLSKALRLDRRAVHDWLRHDRLPARRVDALCKVLGATGEVQRSLRAKAGIQDLADGGC